MYNEAVEDTIGLSMFEAGRKNMAEGLGLREKSITYIAFEAHSGLTQEQKSQYKELVQDLNFLVKNTCIDKDTAEIIAVGALENTLKTNDALAYIGTVKTMTNLEEFDGIPFALNSSNINDQFSIARSIVMGSGLLNYQPHSILAAFREQKSAAAYLYLTEKRLRLRDRGVPESKIESELKKMIAEYFSVKDYVISEGLKVLERIS